MKHDPLADLFSVIKLTEYRGKQQCTVGASKLAKNILGIMKERGYIGGFDLLQDGKGGKFRVSLIGKINDCGVIKPRYSAPLKEFIKYEKRFLPASGVGILLVSTHDGVTDQERAKEKKIGGQLLGYVY